MSLSKESPARNAQLRHQSGVWAVFPATVWIEVQPAGPETKPTSPYERILVFGQLLSGEQKRADLTELTVEGRGLDQPGGAGVETLGGEGGGAMSVLRNPWTVGCLCVIAAVVVGYQFYPHQGPSAPTNVPPTGAGKSPAQAAPTPEAPVAAQTAAKVQPCLKAQQRGRSVTGGRLGSR